MKKKKNIKKKEKSKRKYGVILTPGILFWMNSAATTALGLFTSFFLQYFILFYWFYWFKNQRIKESKKRIKEKKET